MKNIDNLHLPRAIICDSVAQRKQLLEALDSTDLVWWRHPESDKTYKPSEVLEDPENLDDEQLVIIIDSDRTLVCTTHENIDDYPFNDSCEYFLNRHS